MGTEWLWWGQGVHGGSGIQWLCGDRLAVVAKVRMGWLWWGQADHGGRDCDKDRVAVVAGRHEDCVGTGWLWWLRRAQSDCGDSVAQGGCGG